MPRKIHRWVGQQQFSFGPFRGCNRSAELPAHLLDCEQGCHCLARLGSCWSGRVPGSMIHGAFDLAIVADCSRLPRWREGFVSAVSWEMYSVSRSHLDRPIGLILHFHGGSAREGTQICAVCQAPLLHLYWRRGGVSASPPCRPASTMGDGQARRQRGVTCCDLTGQPAGWERLSTLDRHWHCRCWPNGAAAFVFQVAASPRCGRRFEAELGKERLPTGLRLPGGVAAGIKLSTLGHHTWPHWPHACNGRCEWLPKFAWHRMSTQDLYEMAAKGKARFRPAP